MSRVLLGSVAETVTRRSPFPSRSFGDGRTSGPSAPPAVGERSGGSVSGRDRGSALYALPPKVEPIGRVTFAPTIVMPQHVLVPLDGSDRGFAGLEYSLESFPDASITALSVVDPTWDHTAAVGSPESTLERAEERAEAILERAADRVDEHGREGRALLRTGRPHTEILAVATDDDVDHVVLRSHGESPITSPFLGHVSEAVVRRAPVSTTIVPESTAALRERDIPGEVLIPVDGSEQAEAALVYALEAFPEATHTALYVLELPFDRSEAAVEGTYLEAVRADYEDRAEEILESATALADERDASIETATASGTPAEEIIDYAVANEYTQIVMGSHGRSLPARLITGSVAERVGRRSPRTVTLLRGSPTTD